MSEEEGFIRAIQDNPGDEATLLVYADWLLERDDPRHMYLRLRQQALAASRMMAELRHLLDSPAWLACIGERLRVVLVSFAYSEKMDVIHRIRRATDYGVDMATVCGIVDSFVYDPAKVISVKGRFVLKGGLTPEEARDVAGLFLHRGEVIIEPDVD